MKENAHSILVVEDTRDLRDLLSMMVAALGYNVSTAEHGKRAIEMLEQRTFDLLLLDIMMPYMDGYQVLEAMKNDERWRAIPVLVISAVDDIQSVARCIQLGAEDYLPKPFNSVLLNARINACLEKKRLHDQEAAYLKLVQEERELSERLLLNILPAPIAQRLKAGEELIADHFEAVTVLFADIVDFTRLAAEITPAQLVSTLSELFNEFDAVVLRHGLEKIKTSGDAYLAVSGLPIARSDHAQAMADAALELRNLVSQFVSSAGVSVNMRIGMHSGPVVAGVIGRSKFSYDLWGDTVNTASRMEALGLPGAIQVSETTYRLLVANGGAGRYRFEPRGQIEVKGKGEIQTYILQA